MFDWIDNYWRWSTSTYIWRPDDDLWLFHALGWVFGLFVFVVTMCALLIAVAGAALLVLSIPFAIFGNEKSDPPLN